MIRKLVLLLTFLAVSLQAQHTVKGTFINSEKETWVILYRVQGGEQFFVANTTVKDGKYSLNIKKGAQPGIYRLTYRLDKTSYLDFIYNNEDIELSFDPNHPSGTIRFIKSNENRMFKSYNESIYRPQSQSDSLQLLYFRDMDDNERVKIRKAYTANLKKIYTIQNQFENSSGAMLSYHFVKAGRRYNAEIPFKDPTEYLTAIKSHFFDAVDFNNRALLNSTLITDRIVDYIFYVNISSNAPTQEALFKNSVDAVFDKVTDKYFYIELTYYLIKKFAAEENKVLTLYLFDNYFSKLPKADQDTAFKKSILSKLKIALNSKAPNITWEENGRKKSLYGLNDTKYYFVLFWSSTCSHCLLEMPIVYDLLKTKKEIQVIAVGLENASKPWEDQIKEYPRFINVFGKNKWRNSFAKAYNIHATPTYIFLDADKNIIAKPDTLEDVKAFINTLKM